METTRTDELPAASIKGRPDFRMFLSSPADVRPEREAVERVVRRLGGIYAEHVDLQLDRWEPKFYEATKSFQEQIQSTAEFDLVIAIFWKRIGTELPPNAFRRPDGSLFESGTVLEVESALEAAERHGRPAIFVFRKTEAVVFRKETFEDEKRQSDLLDAWWTRTFRDEAGHFLRAAEGFAGTSSFEDRIEDLLVQQLQASGLIPRGPVWDIAVRGSPYPGLKPYDSDRRAVFFGRTLAIRDALDELLPAARREGGLPALFVVGPSGCGKSSLARAGIGPVLTDPGTVPEVNLWRSAKVEVDRGVLTGLAAQLYEALPELAAGPQHASADWARLASGSPEDAAQAVSWALDRAAAAEQQRTGADRPLRARLLLLIDQLERLFDNPDEQVSRLPGVLLALVGTGKVWLLLTQRSDRYTELQNNPSLLELKRRGALYDLPAPGEAEITDAVKGPARAAGLTFEGGERNNRTLPRTLVGDTPSADALPLLQMTLSRLFEARAGMVLSWQAYEAMGGVPGAIASHAGRVFAMLSGAAQRELRRLVEALVRDVMRGPQGQIRFTMVQADSTWQTTPGRRELVAGLVEARLLVQDEPEPGRRVLRAAHEAVLRQWHPAREALERIVDAALRRARLFQIGAVVLALVFCALAIFGWWQRSVAVTERNAANVARNEAISARNTAAFARDAARAQLLAIQARRLAEGGNAEDIEVASALALESIKIARNNDRPIEADAIETVSSTLGRLPDAVLTQGGSVDSLAVLTDGRLASGGSDGKIRIWPKDFAGPPLVLPQSGRVRSLAVLTDGRLASGGDDRNIKIWPKDFAGPPLVLPQSGWVRSLAVLTDGRLASGDYDDTIRIWPKNFAGPPLVLPQGGGFTSLAVLTDGRLASGDIEGKTRIWPKNFAGPPLVLPQGGGVRSLAVLTDGRLASGDIEGKTRIWPKDFAGAPAVLPPSSGLAALTDGRLATSSGDNIRIWPKDLAGTPVILQQGSAVTSLAVLTDGRLASGDYQGNIKIWPKDPLGAPVVLSQGSGKGSSLAVLADGRLASSSGDNIRIWRKDLAGTPVVLQQGSAVTSLAVLTDGRLVSGGYDGNIKIWPEDFEGEPLVLPQGGGVRSLAVLPDGQLASGGYDGNIKIWPKDFAGAPVVLSRGKQVFSLAVLADGRLASGDIDGKIRIWPKDFAGAPVVLTQGNWIVPLAVLADGRLASGGIRDIRIWPKNFASPPLVLPQSTAVWSLAVLADGRLASGDIDGKIRIWPKNFAGAPVVLTQGRSVASLAVLADGQLASGGTDGKITLWVVDEQKLVVALCLRAGRNLTKAEWARYVGSEILWQPSCRGLSSNWRTPNL